MTLQPFEVVFQSLKRILRPLIMIPRLLAMTCPCPGGCPFSRAAYPGFANRLSISGTVSSSGVSLLFFSMHLVMAAGICPSHSDIPTTWVIAVRPTPGIVGVVSIVPPRARRDTSYERGPLSSGCWFSGIGAMLSNYKWNFPSLGWWFPAFSLL